MDGRIQTICDALVDGAEQGVTGGLLFRHGVFFGYSRMGLNHSHSIVQSAYKPLKSLENTTIAEAKGHAIDFEPKFAT